MKSNIHKEFGKCNHINLTIENPTINSIDEKFYAYIIEHNKKHDYYPMKFEFNLVSNNNQLCLYVTSELYSTKTMWYWYKFSKNVLSDLKDKGYIFNQIAEMSIITNANKLDMSYDFYIKHYVHTVEWKLFSMINKDKNLTNKLNRNNCRHPLIRKHSHVPFNIS